MRAGRFGIYTIIFFFFTVITSTELMSANPLQYKLIDNNMVKKKIAAPTSTKANTSKHLFSQKPLNTTRILVKYRNTQLNTKSALINKKFGGSIVHSFKSVNGLNLIKLANGAKLEQALQAYRNDPQVIYAEPDFPLKLRLAAPVEPNDPQFTELWGLNNTGQAIGFAADVGTIDADINALEAWHITTGSANSIVAIIDTGVDYSHVDLKANMWVNPNEIPNNGIDDDNNGYIDDIHGIDTADGDSDPMDSIGHGTHLAGTIAAKGNNTLGVTGVNWDAQIIACKIFAETKPQGINGFVSSAIECLDYLYALKTQHGIDIVATNNSWGWVGTSSMALKEAISRQAEAGILFVAAAGNNLMDNDIWGDNPSSYYLPNVISVAATDNNDKKAFFTNFGQRSVHVGAPGVDILSTFPGNVSIVQNPLNNSNSIFFDDAESVPNNWVAEAPWALTSEQAFSGVQAWSDSPNGDYVANTNISLLSPVIDLPIESGQDIYLAYMSRYHFEFGSDLLFVEFTNDNGQTWYQAGAHAGFKPSWGFSYFPIPGQFYNKQFQFRFRLQSDSSFNSDGIYIDDIGVGVMPAGVDLSSTRYESLSGTSMASPHVVGLLALLKAQDPSRNWKQLKNLVLSGGTPNIELEGNTITGRRIRAADSDGTGSLTCNNQRVQSRRMPLADTVIIKKGSPIDLSVINILCDQPAGEPVAIIENLNNLVTLRDNGMDFDGAADDGLYSTQIQLSQYGLDNATITIHDGNDLANIIDSFEVVTVPPYLKAESISYQWRDLGNNENIMDINQDLLNIIASPFPIRFRDSEAGFPFVGVSTSGYLVLTSSRDEYTSIVSLGNGFLPYTLYSQVFKLENIIAPFWDHMLLTQGNIVWGVVGEAPNRELVVEWRDVTQFEVGGNTT